MGTPTPIRHIKKVWKSIPTIEGAGVRLKRVFGFHEVPQLDPFLLLDCFHSDNRDDYVRGFPWHPHRGIETITYVLDGDVEHQDSLGNKGIIRPGDIQWMTAGSGIALYEPAGNTVHVTTDQKPVRFLLVSGKPLKEPVAWYGPIVMNTKEELQTAFQEFRQGTFIKQQGAAVK